MQRRKQRRNVAYTFLPPRMPSMVMMRRARQHVGGFAVRRIETLLDVSASQGHIVPTTLAEQDGAFYVGNLNLFRSTHNGREFRSSAGMNPKEKILRRDSKTMGNTTSSIQGRIHYRGVTAFGPDGLLYVLELSDAAGFPSRVKERSCA